MAFAQDKEQAPKPIKQLDHRYEGIAKVTGKARYAAEFSDPFSKADPRLRVHCACDHSERQR
jgi:xanthine dehydrogenase YagR molybdenum-binding subunit